MEAKASGLSCWYSVAYHTWQRCYIISVDVHQVTFNKNNSMNCSASVNRELGKLLQTSHVSHLFIFDREVDFLVWWPGSGGGGVHPHDQASVWWCMLHSPLVAILCKYQVYIQYSIHCTSTAVHRAAEVSVCFSRTIYANMTPFSFLNLYYYIMKTLCSFNFDHVCLVRKHSRDLLTYGFLVDI